MTSKTKYPVTQAQLRDIFRAANLGEVQYYGEMSDGWYNNVLGVTTGAGDFVIKIAPEPGVHVLSHEKNLLAQELRFIELMRGHGVRVPKVYHSDCSKEIIPCDYFIMEQLQGTRLDKTRLSSEEKQRAAAQIDAILEAFHGIAGQGYGYEQMGLEANWHLGFRKMVQALADDCASFGKSCRMGEQLLANIDRHRSILEAVPSVLVNFDLHKMNLFWHEGKLTVIDLERCFWGDKIGDSVMRHFFAPPKGFGREEQIRYYLSVAYLGTINYTEKFSRYRPWNQTWWVCYVGSVVFGRRSLAKLRKYR